MRYLNAQELLVIHSEIIDQTGGLHGVRDTNLLQSIIEKPRGRFGGKELYKGILLKAATYLQSLVQYHVFLDGNKRTAIGATARFLFLNGYELKATNKEVESFVLKVAVKKLDLQVIASWMQKHTKRG
ncbi:MAG: type II toxin-antitoxin system death-on-curing family toxin [bacterium]|nr:type II toxin-antitoxin system death-on-curing family toxin [bacterium]